ncbi:MAG TPA: hypothetical protein VHW96_11690 [Solirubrobacteraceae bacterium]|nr:hypothetical protein [Solirubrobacteraceae bacterium]
MVDRADLLAHSGYSRMVANTIAKQTGKPAIVFTRKTTADTDEFGQELFKFSGANNSHPEAHLGELIADEPMREACRVAMRDWVGEPALIENIGGHVEVVSGVCTRENIPHVIAACEAWA